MSHTKLPWHIRTIDGSMGSIDDENGNSLCQTMERESDRNNKHKERIANTKLIVKCVNAHDELVEALNLMLGLASGHIPGSDEFVDVITAKKILEKVKS